MADDIIDLTGDSSDGDAAPPPPRHTGATCAIDLTLSDSDDDVAGGAAPVAVPRLSVAELLQRAEARRKRPRSPDWTAPAEPEWPTPAPHAPAPHAPVPPPPPPRARSPPRKRKRGGGGGGGGGDGDAFHAAVTALELWRPRPVARDFETLTHTFSTAAAYVAAFAPPLLEEAREAIRHAFSQECSSAAAGRNARGILAVRLVALQQPRGCAHGWFSCELEAAGGEALLRLQDGAVAVLSSAPPGRAPLDDLRNAERAARAGLPHAPLLHFAAFVDCARDGDAGGARHAPPRLRFHIPPDDADEHTEGAQAAQAPPLFCGSHVVARLLDASAGPLTWHLAMVGRLASSPAEYRALLAVHTLPYNLRAALLDPMQPGSARPPDYASAPPPPLCGALGGGAFVAHLARTFNAEQRAAIHWVAAAGNAAMQQSVPPGGGAAAQRWPFTLVQGPPGTGKSHTLWGMLNALHVLATRREADLLAAALTRHGADDAQDIDDLFGSSDDFYSDVEDYDGMSAQRRRHEEELLDIAIRCKPHILVCAPSNAAVDVLVARVLRQPFAAGDGDAGGSYTPTLARLASEGTDTHASIAAADCGKRIDALLAQKGAARAARADALDAQVISLTAEIERLRLALADAAAERGRVAALAAACVRLRRAAAELRRLRLAQRWTRSNKELAELSYLDDADIVFTTLGSAGRSIFRRIARPFDIVLIDEAAQATETAALVALQHGGTVVLVGDPAQLPATVLSAAARGAAYERSLFERFTACGVPSLLLTCQYRMHAEIAAFPSAYFYQGRLRTDGSVAARRPEAYEAAPPLHPFAFFDVHQGGERRALGSSSTHNTAEAELAVLLYRRLATLVAQSTADVARALRDLAPRVGIVTPYKGQCDELRRVFKERLGAGVLDALVAAKSINTVDGFQGSEREVIIFSLVRTWVRSGGGGNTRAQLGHVDDVRRMNVGLTRAQRALWVLGHAAALQASPHWARLLEHARRSGRLVRHPSKQSVPDERSSHAGGADAS